MSAPETIDVDKRLAVLDEGGQVYVVTEESHKPIATATSGLRARRIVACVNACVGLSTEALEAGALRGVIDTYNATRVFPPKASQLSLYEAFAKLEVK